MENLQSGFEISLMHLSQRVPLMDPRLDIRYNSAHDKNKEESLEGTNFMNIVGGME